MALQKDKGVMRRRVRLAVGVCLIAVIASAPLRAHQMPTRRSIIVQAEHETVLVLVTWKPSTGPLMDLFAMQSLWGKSEAKVLGYLGSSLGIRALAPLAFLLDGAPLVLDTVETKLVEDPPRSRRSAVVLLISAHIPLGKHTLTVSLVGNEETRIQWLDRSEGRASCEKTPSNWVELNPSFTLRFQ